MSEFSDGLERIEQTPAELRLAQQRDVALLGARLLDDRDFLALIQDELSRRDLTFPPAIDRSNPI